MVRRFRSGLTGWARAGVSDVSGSHLDHGLRGQPRLIYSGHCATRGEI